MTLRTWAFIGTTIAFIVALVVAGGFAWRKIGRDAAAANFSELAVCLVGGPERVAPEDASRLARRLHYEEDDSTLWRCTRFRDALANSRYVRSELPLLASAAESIDLGPFHRRPQWDLENIFRAGESLPWRPPTDLYGLPIRKSTVVLVDAVLPAARNGLSSFRSLNLDGKFDRYPPDRIVVPSYGEADFVIADAPGKPLSRVERAPAPKKRPAPPESAAAGTAPVITLDDVALWIDDTRLHVFRLQDQKDTVVDLPSKSSTALLRSCRTRNERFVAVDLYQQSTIAIFALHDQVVESHSHVDRSTKTARAGSIGLWSLSCEESIARIAWAVSEPSGEPEDGKPFPKDGHQYVVVATCTKGGCSHRETRIKLDVAWFGTGGYGSSWVMATPNVYALGRNVLLVWIGEEAVFYRLAPLEALDDKENGWIAEVSRPGRGLQGDPPRGTAPDPYLLRWPRETMFVRGSVALLSITEDVDKDAASVLVRFDDDGHAEALQMPAH